MWERFCFSFFVFVLAFLKISFIIGAYACNHLLRDTNCHMQFWYWRASVFPYLILLPQDTVRKDCPQDPGKSSRLWLYKDIHNVLIKNSVRDHL